MHRSRGIGKRRHRLAGRQIDAKRQSWSEPESRGLQPTGGSSPAANSDRSRRMAAGGVFRGMPACWHVRAWKKGSKARFCARIAAARELIEGIMEKITIDDIGRLDQLGAAEEKRFWNVFESALASDDGAAAKSHLAACRPIYYCDDNYPDAMVRKWSDGRRELVNVDDDAVDTLIRTLPDAI